MTRQSIAGKVILLALQVLLTTRITLALVPPTRPSAFTRTSVAQSVSTPSSSSSTSTSTSSSSSFSSSPPSQSSSKIFSFPRFDGMDLQHDPDEAEPSSHRQEQRLDQQPSLWGLEHAVKSALFAIGLTIGTWQLPVSVQPAMAADSAKIATCLFQKCQLPLAKCIANPKCLANVVCINTCNGSDDEVGCQIKCGDIFDNEVIADFNKCAVSDMDCVPTKPDDGSYPVPTNDKLVPKFDTSLFNGRWYISAGQNPLFDTFPCQVHFFTETAPGRFFGKLNWRIEEPDGEFFNRDALQRFVQDPDQPAHLINHDNEYLHYEDDWYIIDYAADDNKEGTPPFAFVYYRGSNDAWTGYGGVVVYTRAAKLPEELIPRLRLAAEKVNFDFDKDFTVTDNSCPVLNKGDVLLMREKFAGNVALQTEKQVQAAATRLRGNAANGVKAQKLFVDKELDQAQRAFIDLSKKTEDFEKEAVEKGTKISIEAVTTPLSTK